MDVRSVLAGIAVADHESATDWYARFLGRPADARPMDGLAEWHHPAGVVQVFADPDRAGHSAIALQVADLAAEVERLATVGITPHAVDTANPRWRLATVSDPEGTRITLVEPLPA